MKSAKIVLVSLFVVLMIVGLSQSVFASLANPDLAINPHGIDVAIGGIFSVDIWIRNIPTGYVMTAFDFSIRWDLTMMELVSHKNLGADHGWDVNKDIVHTNIYECSGDAASGGNYAADAKWATLGFRCKAEGSSKITAFGGDTVWLQPSQGGDVLTRELDSDEVTVNQRALVGGVITTTNTLTVLAPYLALIGLVATTAAIAIKKRRN